MKYFTLHEWDWCEIIKNEKTMLTHNPKIGVVGVGMVGGAVANWFTKQGNKPLVYDKYKNLGSPEEVNQAEVVFICVPTPYEESKGGFDLSYVKDALNLLIDPKTIVIKSTVLPGTTEKLQKEFGRHKLLFNPEFLTQASAENDMSFPDRQIVGYTSVSYDVAGSVLRLLPLAPFERIMPVDEAEMVKYFGNTWFSTKVVFANQMYDLCEKLNINYDVVRDAAAADKRIGPSHLNVWHKGYRGYGGACLPKDTKALIQLGQELGANQELLKVVDEVNNELIVLPKKDETGFEEDQQIALRHDVAKFYSANLHIIPPQG